MSKLYQFVSLHNKLLPKSLGLSCFIRALDKDIWDSSWLTCRGTINVMEISFSSISGFPGNTVVQIWKFVFKGRGKIAITRFIKFRRWGWWFDPMFSTIFCSINEFTTCFSRILNLRIFFTKFHVSFFRGLQSVCYAVISAFFYLNRKLLPCSKQNKEF